MRRHFLESTFLYRETGAERLASGENRWLQFSNNRGRGRSRDQVIKFRLLCFIPKKICIKTINDSHLGLNLLQQLSSCLFLPQCRIVIISSMRKINRML